MLDQQVDDFHMTLSKGSHETAHFSVVLTIDVGTGRNQPLHNVQMTT